MPFERLAEHRIRQAVADGVFDRLPNAGQPLDLEEYFKAPEDLRMAYSILKNAKCVPEEVELMNGIAHLDRVLASANDGSTRAAAMRRREELRIRLSILMERRRHQRAAPRE